MADPAYYVHKRQAAGKRTAAALWCPSKHRRPGGLSHQSALETPIARYRRRLERWATGRFPRGGVRDLADIQQGPPPPNDVA